MTPARSSRLHGLDTLRALAILAVVIYHLGAALPPILSPIADIGWIGVDLFFALSGFLIGSQLLRPVTRSQPLDLPAFDRRRAFRILPASLVVLLLYLLVPAWRESPDLPAAWKFLTFTQNLLMIFPGQRAFSHAWSLCIEEHFYLGLPVIALLWSRLSRPSAPKATLLIAAVLLFGIALRSWLLFHVLRAPGVTDDQAGVLMMTRIYYPTPTRLDGLLLGVTLALIRLFRPSWWAHAQRRPNTLLFAGLLVSALALRCFHFDYPSPDNALGLILGFPLLSLGFTLLVASAATQRGLLATRIPGARLLATLAFSLYLTHKEVAHLDRRLLPWLDDNTTWPAAAIYAATCLAVAALLYHLVERPALHLRDRLEPRHSPHSPIPTPQLDPAL